MVLFLYTFTPRTSKEGACRHCQLLAAAADIAWRDREGCMQGPRVLQRSTQGGGMQ